MKYLRLSWEDIERQCVELARMLKRSKVNAEMIIGISRGGLVPARLLSDLLDNHELHTMRVKFYTGIGKVGDKPVILHPTQVDVTGRSVLLVDDIADSGRSLRTAKEHLEKRGAGEIVVATLMKKPGSVITPDFYVQETDAWVIFPWEARETARLIASSAESREMAREELRLAGLVDVADELEEDC
ncbi:MAG: phosphoribosyltransferase [Euryarchaeota archaeon]|nr:phosphoribosyltransferase [Euryarchaeota archaeon]